MKKIPSLFQRNYDGDRLIRDEVTPGCEWVLRGEGVPTVKIDGTACMYRGGTLYKRYDAKKGKQPPAGFIPAQPEADPLTGHWPGWLAVDEKNPADKWHLEALAHHRPSVDTLLDCEPLDWTFELIGPKVQGNPYKLSTHRLAIHGMTFQEYLNDFLGLGDSRNVDIDRSFESLKYFLATFEPAIEGIVFWRNAYDQNCDKAKVKTRDFQGLKWPR